MCLLSKIEEDAWLWHSRLGHVNFQALELMLKKGIVTGMPKFNQPKGVCSGCLMAKQTRKSSPIRAIFITKKKLELIHGDICRPISPTTQAGNRYLFLLADDFTRFMWVYMLNSNDEAFGVFKKFRALVENGHNERIKIFRTDRGGECWKIKSF